MADRSAPRPGELHAALSAPLPDIASVERACATFRDAWDAVRAEIARSIVGQEEVVDLVLVALLADGHALLEGVPGLGKTLLVRTLAEVLDLRFARIQFTPDVMPADITGTSVVVEDDRTARRSFSFRPGPVFANLLLADEINRATPKSQAALLEAMQERSVSIAGETRPLPRPFLVMATQNPIEQEGTYALPEAQLDRFLVKVLVPFTTRRELGEIVARTTRAPGAPPRRLLHADDIIAAQALARRIVVAPRIKDYAVRLVLATHPGAPVAPPDLARWVRIGASPRAAQALVAAARVRALVEGRYAVGLHDVVAMAAPVLRHRLVRTFEAESGGRDADAIVAELVEHLPRTEPAGTAEGSRA